MKEFLQALRALVFLLAHFLLIAVQVLLGAPGFLVGFTVGFIAYSVRGGYDLAEPVWNSFLDIGKWINKKMQKGKSNEPSSGTDAARR